MLRHAQQPKLRNRALNFIDGWRKKLLIHLREFVFFYIFLRHNTLKSMAKGYTQKTESGYEDLKEALIEFKAVQNGEAQSRPLEKLINEL